MSKITEPLVAMRVPVGAESATEYERHAARLGKPVELVLSEQLDRFRAIAPDDRPLVLTSVERELLEQTLGTPIATSTALLAQVRDRVDASLAGVKLAPFAKWQMDELKRRAEKNETTLKVELEKAVADVMRLAFHGMGG
jgi:hypothetical protein